MKKQKQFSLIKRIASFKYALNGLLVFVRTQHNAWVHIAATIIVLFAGFYCNINLYEWCLLCFAIGLVFVAEIFNTAIEFLVDFISPGHNEKAGKIKDIAAAGVLIAAIVSVIIGYIIFVPKIALLLGI